MSNPEPVDLRFRQCPTLPGDGRALITHRIEVPLCQKRQREHYHKCHRCVYRGQSASFVYDAPEPMHPVGEVQLPHGIDERLPVSSR